jgi:hypothetical protein
MHSVALTHAVVRAAAGAGMSDDEVDNLVTYLAENPKAGVDISGTGGCRKVRVAGRGKGKSGGYRTVTFYTGAHLPVFLITVFSKGERGNLSKLERNRLGVMTKAIASGYRSQRGKIAKKGA